MTIRLGRNTIKLVKRARYTYVLPRRYRSKGSVVVRITASGGAFTEAETFSFLVNRGKVTPSRA